MEVNGVRSEADFLTLRLGRDVPVRCDRSRPRWSRSLVEIAERAEPRRVKLRLDGIAFPSGRDLTRFCDDSGEDFDRVEWKQD